MDNTAAARIAASLRTAMKHQGLSGADLADRIERLTGDRPSPVWVSRRLGQVGRRRKALLDVDPDLFLLARALEIDRRQLAALVVAAVLGGPADRPIDYVLTDKQLPPDPKGIYTESEHDAHFAAGEVDDNCPFCTMALD